LAETCGVELGGLADYQAGFAGGGIKIRQRERNGRFAHVLLTDFPPGQAISR